MHSYNINNNNYNIKRIQYLHEQAVIKITCSHLSSKLIIHLTYKCKTIGPSGHLIGCY